MKQEQIRERIDNFIEAHIDKIKSQMEGGEEVTPTAYFLMDYKNAIGGKGYVELPYAYKFFAGEHLKGLLREYIQKCYELLPKAAGMYERALAAEDHFKYELLAVVIISDVFISTESSDTPPEKRMRPKDNPNRREAIMFIASTKKEDITYNYEYTRSERNIEFKLPEVLIDDEKKLKGRLTRLYPNTE